MDSATNSHKLVLHSADLINDVKSLRRQLRESKKRVEAMQNAAAAACECHAFQVAPSRMTALHALDVRARMATRPLRTGRLGLGRRLNIQEEMALVDPGWADREDEVPGIPDGFLSHTAPASPRSIPKTK